MNYREGTKPIGQIVVIADRDFSKLQNEKM